jgi:2-C-methyl-D-erythritol 4-phosphate cytidylyltransferase
LGGRPLIEHAARVLHESPLVATLIVVVTPGWEARLRETLREAGLDAKLEAVVPGGATRQESVEKGLAAINAATHVLVHDAARPFLTASMVQRTADAAFASGAATLALPSSDTLMREDARAMADEPHRTAYAAETLPREGVWSVQTPQAFEIELLREAHREAARRGLTATDDGGVVLAFGRPVALVPGNWWNIKVTRPADLERAEVLLGIRAKLLEEEAS